MELPPKRTPKRGMMKPVQFTGRLTRAQSKNKANLLSLQKTPGTIRKKVPTAIGAIGRLKYEKQILHELKCLDALVLQNICQDKGIPYNGKFEAIFDIAAQRNYEAYGSDHKEEAVPPPPLEETAEIVEEENKEHDEV